MRFLIVNDDGIDAEGIKLLASWAKQYGEVTVVAPKHEQSGTSHAIDFMNPIEIRRVEFMENIEAWSMASTPADCVRFGIFGLHRQYDYVLSGINRGTNMSGDIIYSGTVGAIFEAAHQHHRGIAFSTNTENLNEAAKYLDEAYNYIINNNLFDYANLYNVNIPKEVKGIKITKQGDAYYSDSFHMVEENIYVQYGEMVPDTHPEDIERDTIAFANGYISITPMTKERTDLVAFDKLKEFNK
jgi:5'-nucleotidase